jgi:hypothetical protein
MKEKKQRKSELLKALTEVVRAWESLEGNKSYSPNVISRWLEHDMKPSIDKCRKIIKELS